MIMRNTFIDELVSLAKINSNIALVVGDLGYGVIEPFAEQFPERFINSGVAEQNMMGLAAGMASEGYHVFVYSIGNFPTFRCAEQIRNDVDYHNLPVTIVAVGGGLTYGNLGYSHHTIQDYSLIRSFPNMLIASPGDPLEVRACLRYLVNNPQPSYFRLAKTGEKKFNDSIPLINPGKWLHYKSPNQNDEFNNKIILSTGNTLSIAFNWVQNKYYDYSIASLPLWSQNSKKFQYDQFIEYSHIQTIEDHLLDGGFGSWFLESLLHRKCDLNKISVNALDSKVCGVVGSHEELNAIGGLFLL